MAGGDSQKQLLSLIRDFATEKSQGERRVSDLRKRSAELRTELVTANAVLENAKRCKETTEHDLRGSEVELSLNEASIQAQEARTCLLQEEISKIGSDLGHLKNDEGFSRDDFIKKMFELNKKLRKLQETTIISFHKEKSADFSSCIDQKVEDKQAFNIQDILKAIEDKLVHISAQTHEKEQECNEEENIRNEFVCSQMEECSSIKFLSSMQFLHIGS
ncbi:uncharacterized protein LOC131258304 isoform X2 [Magnolia sinica]|uniref:uncharacterized protein LOC131258304 isoform X2 n=1 Tax=Magnolia sinica TaxID=86752 RepID=UPI00265871CD|nr:uncharacterized protein LOC131258304 isoform X2 [Magnolia sinica]